MKKFFSMMMIATAFVFAACGVDDPIDGPVQGKKLATPELTETHTETSITVSWGAVENAEAYTLNMKGKYYNTEECTYTFENLNAGTYDIRVVAKAEGYEDSEMGKISVTLTGATEVDWFTQTFALPEQDDPENGYYRCNTAEFTWKGTGVVDLVYGIYYSEALEGVDDKTIIADLDTPDGISDILDLVNSADGFSARFGAMLEGETSYTLCVQVENADGMKFFTKNEVTTEKAEASEAAKAWLGTWEVTSHQIYTLDQEGNGVTSDKEEKFDVTVVASSSNPDEVLVYNHTVLGPDVWPAIGQVYDNQLYLLNGVNLGPNEDNSYYYYWLGWYDLGDGNLTPTLESIPFAIVEVDGNTAISYNQFTLYDTDNNEVSVTCHACDIFGVSDQGSIYFLIDAWPAVYRTGQMDWVKKEAAPSARSLSFQKPTFNALQSNVVVK